MNRVASGRAIIVNTHDITIVIVAHNAEATIARAVLSAVADSKGPILLVDDFSEDDTAHEAAQAGGEQITIVQPREHIGVGNARQTAIEHIKTPFGIWLDADDAFMKGRTERHLSLLQTGSYDLVYDAGVLVDGATNEVMHNLPIPDFILKDGKISRQFERNWLPLTQCSFNTAFAREIGYDTSFKASEDYDFMLRALVASARHGFLSEHGYRYYHYPNSVSRSLKTATNFSDTATAKHANKNVKAHLYCDRTLNDAERLYTQACHALACIDVEAAQACFNELVTNDNHIAPYLAPASATAHFMLGSLYLLQNKPSKGLEHLRLAHAVWQDKEVKNNLAVAMWQTGDHEKAKAIWQEVASQNPSYLDAVLNHAKAEQNGACHITRFPLRPTANRSEYNG